MSLTGKYGLGVIMFLNNPLCLTEEQNSRLFGEIAPEDARFYFLLGPPTKESWPGIVNNIIRVWDEPDEDFEYRERMKLMRLMVENIYFNPPAFY